VTEGAEIGLPTGWRCGVVEWAQKNDSVRELWLPTASTIGALGNYAALGSRWRADLEAIVGC
jgi:hypothetical protein